MLWFTNCQDDGSSDWTLYACRSTDLFLLSPRFGVFCGMRQLTLSLVVSYLASIQGFCTICWLRRPGVWEICTIYPSLCHAITRCVHQALTPGSFPGSFVPSVGGILVFPTGANRQTPYSIALYAHGCALSCSDTLAGFANATSGCESSPLFATASDNATTLGVFHFPSPAAGLFPFRVDRPISRPMLSFLRLVRRCSPSLIRLS